MTDIALIDNIGAFDFALKGADLETDEGLNAAVVVSLFCDARADSDEIPEGEDPRGWWADHFAENSGDQTGSKLWLLGREKQIPEVLARAQEYAQEALAWLVDDGVASGVTVDASFPQMGALELAVSITRPRSGASFERRYQYVWESYE